MRRTERGDPPKDDRPGRVRILLRARREGATLRQAADLAGVHVSSVCRWQRRDPGLRQDLDRARSEWRDLSEHSKPRPSVPWHGACPLCRARVVVRSTRRGVRFWRCGCWPHCPWASWRPRAPRNCPRCGGPRFWSHSRKSVACESCGVRTSGP